MAKPPNEDIETFLYRQNVGDLVAVLLELANDHEAVQARLARMQLADRLDKLAAGLRKGAAWLGDLRSVPSTSTDLLHPRLLDEEK